MVATRHRLTPNDEAAILAVVAGVFLLAAGVSGAPQFERTFLLLHRLLGPLPLLRPVAFLVVSIAAWGGFAVIAGGLVVRLDHPQVGKVLMYLGTGFSVFSLAAFVVLQLADRTIPFAGGIGFGAVGVVLSIAARFRIEG